MVSELPAPPAGRQPHAYELRDATGIVVAIHERREPTVGPKTFVWRQPDGSLGLGGLPTADLPLYGIERLDGLATTVVIVEGEKAAEALWALDIAAVGTVTGSAGTPSAGVLAELTGRAVILWPDNDAVGRGHMERLGARLTGVASELRLIEWPEAPAKGDAADFVAAGGTTQKATELISAARPVLAGPTPEPAPLESTAWEPPMPLDRLEHLPGFPIAGLPDWLRTFVLAEAEATQTPIDMGAMFVLAALATVVAGHVEIEPVAGWREGLNLFIVVAMEPGSRKSAVHRDVIGPIIAYERLLVERAQPDIAEQATIRRIAEASLSKAEKAAAGAKDPLDRRAAEEEARTLASALDRLGVVAPPRLFTADVTPEKLASLLHENGGRMAVLSAEGGIFDIMAGRYSSGLPNLDVYLQGHAGDPIRVDRRGRPPEFVDRPALTMGLAVQPYVLAKAARIGDFGGRGLFDRCLFALPAGMVGYRQTASVPMPAVVRQSYDTSLRALAASFDRFDAPVTLRLALDAGTLFDAWRAEIEPRRRPDADLGHIQGWSSKLDGAVIRIAGLLHLAETITSDWDSPISTETVTAAIEIGRYLTAHALAAFGVMAADPRLEAAHRIARWIAAHDRATFTKRDVFRALRGQVLFPSIDRIAAGLAVLEELGWVRALAPERTVGRPTSRFETNPEIVARTRTKWPELAGRRPGDEVLAILSSDSSDSLDTATRQAPADTPANGGTSVEPWEAFPALDHGPRDNPPDDWGTIG